MRTFLVTLIEIFGSQIPFNTIVYTFDADSAKNIALSRYPDCVVVDMKVKIAEVPTNVPNNIIYVDFKNKKRIA